MLLALIGKRWISAEDNDGEMRLFDENDFVRKEIASAMDQGITVIPLLVERAEMPTPGQLPNALHKLCDQQATHVRPSPDFKKDVAKLIRDLEDIELAKGKITWNEPAIEPEVRSAIRKPTGELTKADLETLQELNIARYRISDVSDLEKLECLTWLTLNDNKIEDISALTGSSS